jgi:hypothetical protein
MAYSLSFLYMLVLLVGTTHVFVAADNIKRLFNFLTSVLTGLVSSPWNVEIIALSLHLMTDMSVMLHLNYMIL